MTEHQPREHDVLCRWCLRSRTWEWDGICLECKLGDEFEPVQRRYCSHTRSARR